MRMYCSYANFLLFYYQLALRRSSRSKLVQPCCSRRRMSSSRAFILFLMAGLTRVPLEAPSMSMVFMLRSKLLSRAILFSKGYLSGLLSRFSASMLDLWTPRLYWRLPILDRCSSPMGSQVRNSGLCLLAKAMGGMQPCLAQGLALQQVNSLQFINKFIIPCTGSTDQSTTELSKLHIFFVLSASYLLRKLSKLRLARRNTEQLQRQFSRPLRMSSSRVTKQFLYLARLFFFKQSIASWSLHIKGVVTNSMGSMTQLSRISLMFISVVQLDLSRTMSSRAQPSFVQISVFESYLTSRYLSLTQKPNEVSRVVLRSSTRLWTLRLKIASQRLLASLQRCCWLFPSSSSDSSSYLHISGGFCQGGLTRNSSWSFAAALKNLAIFLFFLWPWRASQAVSESYFWS